MSDASRKFSSKHLTVSSGVHQQSLTCNHIHFHGTHKNIIQIIVVRRVLVSTYFLIEFASLHVMFTSFAALGNGPTF